MKWASIAADSKKLEGRKELAFGEVTGHAHRVVFGDLFEEKDGNLYLKNSKTDPLTHEEHKRIDLTPGCRHVVIKRQAVGETWEEVRD